MANVQRSRRGTTFRALLGQRVKARREELGLSQRAIGEVAGLSATQVCRIEAGATTGTDTLELIADALKTTVGELTVEADSLPKGGAIVNGELHALVKRLESERPDRLERAKGFLQALLYL
jgi:transcriptional regulator with XRE-family HTH domain